MEQNNNTLSLIVTLLTFIVTLLIFSYYIITKKIINLNPKCTCEICNVFITSSWREKFKNLPDWYTYLLKKSPTKTIHIHVLNNIITANSDNVEYILKTNFDNYPKGKPTLAILGDLLGHGIFNVDGDHWRFQRKLASLELGSNSIRAYAHQVLAHEITARLICVLDQFIFKCGPCGPNLNNNNNNKSLGLGLGLGLGFLNLSTLDLQVVFRKFAFDNICKFSFGVDPVGLPGFDEAFDVASNLSAERALNTSSVVWRVKRMFNIGSERRLKSAIKKVNLLASSIIKENRENKFVNKGNLLSRFMGSVSNDKYLRDVVVSFLLAGRDTNASGLTMLFYLLARHPEVEDRILEESIRVMGPNKEISEARSVVIPTLEELREMHYLHATVYETIRLFPPVQMDSKFANASDILPDGTKVESGTRVAYHPYAMGRMEEIWGSDFIEFRPERWLNNEGVFVPVDPFKYPAFQAGVRVCLGKDLALLVMKTVTLALVQRFKIRLADPNWTPQFIPGLSATIKGGMPVTITER